MTRLRTLPALQAAGTARQAQAPVVGVPEGGGRAAGRGSDECALGEADWAGGVHRQKGCLSGRLAVTADTLDAVHLAGQAKIVSKVLEWASEAQQGQRRTEFMEDMLVDERAGMMCQAVMKVPVGHEAAAHEV